MKTRLAVALLIAAAAFAPSASADETTFCDKGFITTLPFTITAQGHYCLNKNLSTSITTGAAITVKSDFVTIDMNNFKLGGGGAGLGTAAAGVFAFERTNLTVRGGNIRGFRIGIHIDGTNTNDGRSTGHLVENNVLDGNTQMGVWLLGTSSVVRNNTVANTGGSTNPVLSGGVWGIYTYAENYQTSYTATLAQNNFVVGTVSPYVYAYGIGQFPGMTVANNIDMYPSYAYSVLTRGVCRDNNSQSSGGAIVGFGLCALALDNLGVYP